MKTLENTLEGLLDVDKFDVDVDKTWEQFKKEFSQKIGFGKDSADVKFFENSLEFIKTYCENHRSKTYALTYSVYVNIPDKYLEIGEIGTGGNGYLATYTWKVVGKTVEYGCDIDYYTGLDRFWEMKKDPNYIFVKYPVLQGIMKRR